MDTNTQKSSQTLGTFLSIASLAIRAISFQLWLLYFSLSLVFDPFRTMKLATHAVVARLVTSNRHLRQLALRLAKGCFCAAYVFFLLSGLLAMSFVGGRMAMKRITEEPVSVTEALNFDYTKTSPMAVVPLVSDGNAGHGRWRLVPPGHRMQLTVSLTLPESDYNRKLGIFQVRAEFLNVGGKTIATTSHPSMLRFKSSSVRLVETFVKSGSLLAGFYAESQTLSIKMSGFTGKVEPTACMRVILEKRAEQDAGAGIPEIYAASVSLESDLTGLQRMIWNWRMTVFVWISMGLFSLELLLVMICFGFFIQTEGFSMVRQLGKSLRS